MPKIHVEKKDAKELADSLKSIFQDIYVELTNNRTPKTAYMQADLIELDKTKLNTNIATITGVLKEIKSLREFNPKKRQL